MSEENLDSVSIIWGGGRGGVASLLRIFLSSLIFRLTEIIFFSLDLARTKKSLGQRNMIKGMNAITSTFGYKYP